MANKRKHSSEVVDGIEKAPARAMLRAVGFTDADFEKPQIGVASTWSMVTPCNMHINELARYLTEFVRCDHHVQSRRVGVDFQILLMILITGATEYEQAIIRR